MVFSWIGAGMEFGTPFRVDVVLQLLTCFWD